MMQNAPWGSQIPLVGFSVTIAVIAGCFFLAGKQYETLFGKEAKERAAAIDACAREANVYPESCAMKAVVVSPTMPARTAALPDLLPPPVES